MKLCRWSGAGRRRLRPLLFLTLAALLAGCSMPQEPGRLAWNARLALPFGVRTYALSELASSERKVMERGSGIVQRGDSLWFVATARFASALQDALRFPALLDSVTKAAGTSHATGYWNVPAHPPRVFRGRIRYGTATITFRNLSPDEPDTARLTVPSLHNFDGTPLQMSMPVPTGASVDTTVNLVNYELVLDDSVVQHVTAVLAGSQTAETRAVLQLAGITFGHVVGDFTGLELPTQERRIVADSLPTGWEGLKFTDVEAAVNTLFGPALTATARVGLTATLPQTTVDTTLTVDSLALNRDSSVVLYGLGSCINDYPDSLLISARVTLTGRGECTPLDSARLLIEVRAPFRFSFEPVHPPGDVERIESRDLRDIASGQVRVLLWNHLPVGARVFVVADRDSHSVLPNSGASVDTLAAAFIPAPALANGHVVSESDTTITVALSDSVLDLFRYPPFFARTDVELVAGSSDTLVCRASDYLKVQVRADLLYRVDTGGAP